jgi:hypothetical protein
VDIGVTGILAIWNDCLSGHEIAYEEWYQDEHLAERVSITGFQIGRRFQAVHAARQFLTTYELERPEVLTSAAYRAKVANPTVRTAEIMRSGFANMCRTACERQRIMGTIRGGVAVTVSFARPGSLGLLHQLAKRYPISPQLTHSEIWIPAKRGVSAISNEETLRGRDSKISSCLTLEFLRQEPAMLVADETRRICPEAEVGVYRLMCVLRREDLEREVHTGASRRSGQCGGDVSASLRRAARTRIIP